jgi:hypothetical protein
MLVQTLSLFVALTLLGGAIAADASGGSPTIVSVAPTSGSPTSTAPVDDASGGSPTH